MAAVLETLTVPRSRLIPSASLLPVAGSSTTSLRFSRSAVHSARAKLTSRSKPARRAHRFVCEAQDIAVEVAAVNDSAWQSCVLECDTPVLVEFWAPWCGPCRMIHPVIDSLAKEYAGKLKCYKVNTDECPTIATQYGIRSIPTVLIFKNGEKKDAVIGAVPEGTLKTSIEKFL